MQFWLVDAFSELIYSGNPAGVMLLPDFFPDEILLKIAAEVNQVETSFVKPLGNSRFHLRWFSPSREVKLCGHATLAAAHVLWEEGLVTTEALVFETLSGELPVLRSEKGLTMNFPLQIIGDKLNPDDFFEIFLCDPVNVVTVGDDILVELPGAHLVRNLKFDVNELLAFNCRAVIVTSRGDEGYDIVSRLFAPKIGIVEDAVSAASHCKLADYWQKATGKSRFRAYQASARGGEILVEVVGERVHLTGQCKTVIKGEFATPFE